MEVTELASLANNNNNQAQEEVMSRCLKGSMSPLLASIIDPFSWEGIKERACQDERYVYLLLHFREGANITDLYVELLKSIKIHAEAGDPLAQTNLGYMYRQALGVKVDHKEAYKWYRVAAGKGFAIAQKQLGDMHFENFVGNVVRDVVITREYKQSGCKNKTEYNEKKAVELYKQAAKQGYVPGLTSLGQIYQKAGKIYRRYKQAIEEYKQAAAQGDTQAKFYLGETYYYGENSVTNYKGVDANHVEAFKWFSEAANEGHPEAQAQVGQMYNNGEWVEQDFIEAAEWYRKAAKGGSRYAQTHMGMIYQEGQGVSKDLAQAVYWYMQAKEMPRLLSVKSSEFPLLPRRVVSTNQGEIDEIESNLLSSWQGTSLPQEQSQANEYVQAYRQLSEIINQFKEWRFLLHTQSELMISCVQFEKPGDRIATGVSHLMLGQKFL